jgi:hypothetical protein
MSLTNTSSFSLSTFLFMPQGEWEEGSVKIAACRGKYCPFGGWGVHGCKRREGYLGCCLGYEKCQFDCPSWHVAVSVSRTFGPGNPDFLSRY